MSFTIIICYNIFVLCIYWLSYVMLKTSLNRHRARLFNQSIEKDGQMRRELTWRLCTTEIFITMISMLFQIYGMFYYMLLESFFPQPFNFGNQICKTYGSKLCKYLGKIIIQELTKQHEASAKQAEMEVYN